MFRADEMELHRADDNELAAVWDTMTAEHKVDLCFPNERMTKEQFIDVMQRYNWAYAGYYRGQLGGFAWINRWEHRTARLNFCMFAASGRALVPLLREAGRRLIGMRGEDGQYCFDVLLSYIRVDNHLSAKAARLAGMREAGRIPGYYPDGDVFIYSLQRS